MHLDFDLLSMTELRNRPGELLDRVADKREAFIIERNGHRMACLVPLSVFFPDIAPARIAAELHELEEHGEAPRTTITDDRELVFKFTTEAAGGTPVEIQVLLPHGYPHGCPKVYAVPVNEKAPHRWADGALCLYGVLTGWNPGKHTVYFTLQLARQWLDRYATWEKTGEWRDNEERSNE